MSNNLAPNTHTLFQTLFNTFDKLNGKEKSSARICPQLLTNHKAFQVLGGGSGDGRKLLKGPGTDRLPNPLLPPAPTIDKRELLFEPREPNKTIFCNKANSQIENRISAL